MRITCCKVNHIENPLGYQLEVPAFSWVTEEARGKRQASARLRIWQDAEKASCLYDSGWEVLDSLATQVSLALQPRTRYYWTAAVRSDADEEAESGINWFETGKQEESCLWKAPIP